MKLQVLQENFSKALNITSRFTSTKAQLPVLANVLLIAKSNKLIIASTNLEISVSLSIGAKVSKQGELTVPARVVADVVSNLIAGSINLQAEKERLTVSTQNISSQIAGMNSSDFPSVPHSAGKGVIQFPKDEFLDALSQVIFAASIDETRPVLTGVLFVFSKNHLILVATDGFRLSRKKIKLKVPSSYENVILPKSALSELTRLSDDNGSISFSFRKSDNQVVFGFPNATMASRIIEGEFPDFEKIIPTKSSYEIYLDREELLRAVKLASVFARDSANVIKVQVKKSSLMISAESSQSGSQETEVDAKVKTNKALTGKDSFIISFNFRFLEELLNAVTGDEVRIDFSDSNSPGVFTDPKDKDFLHLIMPVRTQD